MTLQVICSITVQLCIVNYLTSNKHIINKKKVTMCLNAYVIGNIKSV